MKYKQLTLNLNYETYEEYGTNSLNGYRKNQVNYTLGELMIFVDKDDVEKGKKKLLKYLDKIIENTKSKIKL